MHSKGIDFEATSRPTCRKSIGMYRNKQVGSCLVGNIGTLLQRYKHIGLTSIYDLHIWAFLLHESSEFKRYIEIDYLLLGNLTYRSCIVSAVTGIDNQREALILSRTHSCYHQQHYI